MIVKGEEEKVREREREREREKERKKKSLSLGKDARVLTSHTHSQTFFFGLIIKQDLFQIQ
jgi:hypothetical protein